MTDERLIEAARVAFVEAWEAERKKIGRGTAEPGTKTRAGIIAALAVFEKAHTPTDDERAEWTASLESLIADVYTILKPIAENGSHGPNSPILKAYGLLNAQDLRRPEEPSAENGTPRDYQAYELTVDMLEDLLVTAGVLASEHGIAIRKTAGALVYKIGRCLAPEPQGEPSDAQVRAARREWIIARVHGESRNEAMRAALRAAEKVNPSVGEKPL